MATKVKLPQVHELTDRQLTNLRKKIDEEERTRRDVNDPLKDAGDDIEELQRLDDARESGEGETTIQITLDVKAKFDVWADCDGGIDYDCYGDVSDLVDHDQVAQHPEVKLIIAAAKRSEQAYTDRVTELADKYDVDEDAIVRRVRGW